MNPTNILKDQIVTWRHTIKRWIPFLPSGGRISQRTPLTPSSDILCRWKRDGEVNSNWSNRHFRRIQSWRRIFQLQLFNPRFPLRIGTASSPDKRSAKTKRRFFLRAETFYNVATNIEELDREPRSPRIIDQFGGVSLHEQSHGESFFAAFTHRFRGKGLYIMDEPEAALSPLKQLSMLSRINELAGQSSQFIIATHSPVIMAYPDALLYEFTKEGVRKTTLENTEHFTLMKQFFDDKERMLFHLFNTWG